MSEKKLSREEKIAQTNRALLVQSATDMIGQMRVNKDAKYMRQLAYQHWDERLQCELQVHVMVVRDEDVFLEPFQTEVTN